MKKLLEQLAELEHKQWEEWSRDIAKNECISRSRADRWLKLWIPYERLTEEQKEEDRNFARRALDTMKVSIKDMLEKELNKPTSCTCGWKGKESDLDCDDDSVCEFFCPRCGVEMELKGVKPDVVLFINKFRKELDSL